MKIHLTATSGALLAGMSLAAASPVIETSYCSVEGLDPALRQTIVIIDGQMITPEERGGEVDPANTTWRQFASDFVDATNPMSGSLLAPRERVTLLVAKADGSGVVSMFSGCVPVYSQAEAVALSSADGVMAKFTGTDWNTRNEKGAESFVGAARRGIVENSQGIGGASEEARITSFADGALISSLRRNPAPDLTFGIPRYVIYTDLSKYTFPDGDLGAVRNAGFADARGNRLDLGNAEIHVLSKSPTQEGDSDGYLPAFFLAGHGAVKTLGSTDGGITPSLAPSEVRIFQGTADFGDVGVFGLRMRLATDVNGTLTNSWLEELRQEPRFLPVGGTLTCAPGVCKFVGDNVFGQIWATAPGAPKPDCRADLAFGGMRNLSFELANGAVNGVVNDSTCFIAGQEGGLPIELVEVPRGKW